MTLEASCKVQPSACASVVSGGVSNSIHSLPDSGAGKMVWKWRSSGAVCIGVVTGAGDDGAGMVTMMGSGVSIGSSMVEVTSVIIISSVLDVPTSGSSIISVVVVVGVSTIISGIGSGMTGALHASQNPGVARSVVPDLRFVEDVALIQLFSSVRIIEAFVGSDEPAGGVFPSPTVSMMEPSGAMSSIFNALFDSEMAVVMSCTDVATVDLRSSGA